MPKAGVITLEYPEFFLVTCYTPNAQNELRRLDYRIHGKMLFGAYLTDLKQQKTSYPNAVT